MTDPCGTPELDLTVAMTKHQLTPRRIAQVENVQRHAEPFGILYRLCCFF